MRTPPIAPDDPITREFRTARGRFAGASKNKHPAEELERLRGEMIVQAVRKAVVGYVQSAPPLSDAQVEAIVSTLLAARLRRAAEVDAGKVSP